MDLTRGIAILLVVAYHATTVPLQYIGVPVPPVLIDFTTMFAPYRMSLLFLLSGLLLTRSLQKSPQRYISGKVGALVWPVLLWMVIGGVVEGQSQITEGGFWYPDNWLWFLAYLVVYYAAAPFLTKIPGMWFLAVPAGLWSLSMVLQSGELSKLTYFAGFFFVGHCATMVAERLRPRESTMLMAGCLAVAGSLAALLIARNHGLVDLFLDGADAYRPVMAPVVLVAIAGLVMLARRMTAATGEDGGRLFRWVHYMGRQSVVFYLVHVPVQILIARYLAEVGVIDPKAVFLLCFFGGLAAGALLVGLRRYRVVDALFVLPSRKSRPRLPVR